MGRMIKKGLLILSVVLLNADVAKAEVIINIKIPDEIKLDVNNAPDEDKIGDFKDDTENIVIQGENPRNTLTEEDINILQKIAIAEAGNTDAETMSYVMQTVLNRVYSDKFPDSVFAVISQKGQFSTYPSKYNKAVPNDLSNKAIDLLGQINNKGQLYFENTVEGSWQSTHLQHVFDYNVLNFYK